VRVVPPLMVEALAGSVPDSRMVFHTFYDGRLSSIDPLPAGPWSLKWSARSRQIVRSEGSVVVGDETGSLSPWGLSDSLSAAGSQVSAVFHCGGESLDLARFTVVDNRPDERFLRAAGVWVYGGASVGVTLAELSKLVQDDEFIAAESPPSGATVVSEIRRLLLGRCGVIVDPAVDDRELPPMVHPENRLEALYTLVDMVGDARFTGDGQLYVYVPAAVPQFTVQGKPMGDLVGVSREQKRDNFYNVVVSTGKDDAGNELKAYSRVMVGPLRDGGPFGRRVYRHNAVANTQEGVQSDADTTLENLLRDSTVEIPFECLPSALIFAEAGDYGQVMFPAVDGQEYALPGRLLEASLSGDASGFKAGAGVIAARSTDVERIGTLLAGVRRNP
jgi:hypothetical protein